LSRGNFSGKTKFSEFMKIFIAAGHGGTDSGAVANGTTEREEAIKVVDGAVQLLRSIIQPSQNLILVPHNLALGETVPFINQQSANDICLELHFNSNAGVPGTGTETYYGLPLLASKVQQGIAGVLGLTNRGTKDGNQFYFNNSTKPGSALVEIGFINNPVDLQKVRELGARALAKGVADYLGLTLPSAPLPQPPGEDWKKKYETEAGKVKFLKDEISKILIQV
jgi:N-acetylmuramoyl-L-alanine amidase